MQKYWNTVQDEHGNPRYGASVSVQQSSANATIYTDAAGLVPASNPLTTDSTRGYFEFYAPPGAYDLVVTGVGFASYTITAGAEIALPPVVSAFDFMTGAQIADVQAGTGLVDVTSAINAAINSLCSDPTSAYTGNGGRGGTVYCPPGVYSVTKVIRKSGVHIRGAGIYATRFKPTAATDYAFGVTGTTTTSRLANSGIYDLSIGPNDTWTAEVSPVGNKPQCGGIDNTYVTVCPVENVLIHNLGGIGFNNVETYESVAKYLTLFFCGTATVPSVSCYQGTADVTNNMRFFHLVVASTFMLKVGTGTAATTAQQRTITFDACYFEWGQGSTVATGPGIVIEASRCVKFVGSDFVANRTTAQSLIKFQDSGGSSDVAACGLDGCGFIGNAGMTGKLIESAATRVINIGVSGCKFSDVTGGPCISGPSFNITGFSAYGCLGPMIDVSASTLAGIKAGGITGTGIAIKLNGCVASAISLDAFAGNGTTGIQCVTAASIIDNVKIALGGGGTDNGIDFQVTGNKVANALISSTTPYTGIASFEQNNWYDDDGTFTGSLTGCTTVPTGTIRYSRRGKSVTLDVPVITGTSNTNACTITGGPNVIKPIVQKQFIAATQDNSAAVIAATCNVETTGVIALSATIGSTVFTAANTKGMANKISFSYTLN